MDPVGTPAPQLAQLEFFTGTWEGDGAFLDTAFGPALTQPVLRVEAAFTHRGHWLEQRFTWIEVPRDADGPVDLVEATRIWGYDRIKDQLVSEWFDNRGRRATVVTPGWDDDRLIATSVIVDGGRTIRLRETFIKVDDRQWKHNGEMDFGHGWTTSEEQVLHRVGLC